jgi:hypothetical protein
VKLASLFDHFADLNANPDNDRKVTENPHGWRKKPKIVCSSASTSAGGMHLQASLFLLGERSIAALHRGFQNCHNVETLTRSALKPLNDFAHDALYPSGVANRDRVSNLYQHLSRQHMYGSRHS